MFDNWTNTILNIALLHLAVFVPVEPTAAQIVSTFDRGNEGWVDICTDLGTVWSEVGGNPGGHLPVFSTPYFLRVTAPPKFLGDWTAYELGEISYDHFVGVRENVSFVRDHRVEITGPGGHAIWEGQKAGTPGSGWSTIVALLDENEWILKSGDWRALISNVRSFTIDAELYSNSGPSVDEEGIDNVMLIPFLGDINCDGEVNLLDVAPFVDAISAGTFVPKADINQDGVADLLDINPFVDLLTGP